MAESEGYIFCNDDLQVHAGDRTRKHGFWTTLGGLTSEGLCEYSVCGPGDVRAWFSAANAYITGDFTDHFNRYKKGIQMSQGAASIEQQQIMQEAADLLNKWANYAKHYRAGGGGPVGESIQSGGYSWKSSWRETDPGGPGHFDFLDGGTVFDLCAEIADKYYGPASCIRDKFNESRADGMLAEIPGYGGVTRRPPAEAASSDGMGIAGFAIAGLGAWVLLKALSD